MHLCYMKNSNQGRIVENISILSCSDIYMYFLSMQGSILVSCNTLNALWFAHNAIINLHSTMEYARSVILRLIRKITPTQRYDVQNFWRGFAFGLAGSGMHMEIFLN